MTLLEMSLSGGCVILAGALLRVLAKDRLPRWTFEALWALAVLRLTVPVGLPFRFSVWALLERTAPAAASAEQTGAAMDIINIIYHTAAAPVTSGPSPWFVLWIVVACLLALIFAVGYIRGYRRFRDAEEVDINLFDYLPSVRLPRRKVAVRATDRVGAPLTYGLVRPVILLPRTLDRTEAGPLGFVLAHELAHIRRLDTLRKLILAAAVCVHWFDPLVWVLYVLASRDMELACDLAVIRACGPEARQSYAHALLDMEQQRAGLAGLASGFSRNAVEERIRSLIKPRRRSFLSAALALALVLGVGAVFATAAPADETVTPVGLADQVSALMGGDGTTLPGCTDFRGHLGPYEKVYFDVGWVDKDEAVTAAVSADKKMGCHVSVCPAGEGPGDYLTAVDPDKAASSGAAEPASGDMLSSSSLRPGRYAVCVWSSVNEPIEFALSYMVS